MKGTDFQHTHYELQNMEIERMKKRVNIQRDNPQELSRNENQSPRIVGMYKIMRRIN